MRGYTTTNFMARKGRCSYRGTTSGEIVFQFGTTGRGQIDDQIDLVVGDHITDIGTFLRVSVVNQRGGDTYTTGWIGVKQG